MSRPFWYPITTHAWPLKPAKPPTMRQVIGESAIAVQFMEIGEEAVDVVECARTLRMAGNLGNPPRISLA